MDNFQIINTNLYPLVTIGIPFYNSSLFLNDAIQSVLNQTYQNWQLILIDDGSTDDSLEIARLYKDKRIKIIADGKNLGLINRLNQIILLAEGKYIARMDSDDVMIYDRIEKQVKYFIQNKDCDVIGSSYYVIDNKNKLIGEKNELKLLKSKADILKKGGIAHPTVMAHTTWFLNNLYDSRFQRFEDFELWYRTVEKSNFCVLEDKLLFYRSVGVPTNKKYLQTNLGLRTFLINQFFKLDTPKFVLFIHIFKSELKIILYSLMNLFNLIDLIVLYRYKKIDEKEIENVESYLKQSLSLGINEK